MTTLDRRQRGYAVLVLLALLAGLIAGWRWSSRLADERAEDRDDLHLFLSTASLGSAEITEQFFEVPQAAARTIAGMGPLLDSQLARLMAETLRALPPVDAAFIGYPDGSFLFVGRSDEDPNGFRTRTIAVQDRQRTVELAWTDVDFAIQRSETDTDDRYDPRARPWYGPIADGQESWWTEPYIFASSQEPGITHSVAMRGADGVLQAVVGVDMRITDLGGFLDDLRPGFNGDAAVLSVHGTAIATAGRDGEPARLNEILLRGDQLPTDTIMRSDNEGYTTIIRPLTVGDDWFLAMRAFDPDFVSDGPGTAGILGTVAVAVAVAGITGAAASLMYRYLTGLKREAELDELTGVLNRRALHRHLEFLVSHNSFVQVAIIDLDGFKSINDDHGHPTGDAVLATVASRIDRFANDAGGSAGRLGGDEFLIATNGNVDWGDLGSTICEPVVVGGRLLETGASIGIAISTSDQPFPPDELIRQADRALFDVKRSGGGAFALAEP